MNATPENLLHLPIVIGHEERDKGTFLPVYDPATGHSIGSTVVADAAIVDWAVTRAAQVFPAWAASEGQRVQALQAAAASLGGHVEELAALLARETGHSLAFARIEVQAVIGLLGGAAARSTPVLEPVRYGALQAQPVYVPYGVVAAIGPWNVPLILLFQKIADALRAGNTVVAKPSEYTPLSTVLIGRLIRGHFPDGVLSILAGGAQTGEQLVAHPLVSKISFTGSVATGQRILGSAAARVVPVTAELGGNDPAIVFEDVNPQDVIERLFWGSFFNSGQICFAIKRLYVHDSLYDTVVAGLAERAQRTRLGGPTDPTAELGPLTTKAQFLHIQALVSEARAQGAIIHSGGEVLAGPGFFYPPTIVTNLAEDSRLVAEEQFGPVLPVLRFSDTEDVIQRANNTRYGLGASVWSADTARAAAVGARLRSGLLWVNGHGNVVLGAPKAGFGASGLGVEGGQSGYESYLNIRTLYGPVPETNA
ncbi:aldehyde dehydrogenase family protein [Acetobacter cibinongensis]|uniref:aldehyde dehydrogenase family protein n=1 Tax=Acetobacter cibinongensis TaxID=146475 RepID=UPI000A396B20|nr:aldehyde dehydrogenase family protein [Acetobacter cibinongensis]